MSGGISFFDSGMGGLSVLKHFLELFPGISVTYLGDTARFPYGTKSRETIVRFAREDARFLAEMKPDLIIAACFTVSSQAFEEFSDEVSPIPTLGVLEAGARVAARLTRSGAIGVLATEGTIRSNAYPRLIAEIDPGIGVFAQPCPLFAPLVEEGWVVGDVAEAVSREYLTPYLTKWKNVDTMILGCTHYPPLLPVLQKILPEVTFIDPGYELAREILNRNLVSQNPERPATMRFFVTDGVERFSRVGENLLKHPIADVVLVDPVFEKLAEHGENP
ncbi:MAG: glutamate racemase [Leptospirillum sp.]|nr:glutamate racemase [Nitrospiraceae bacterium]